MTEQSANLTGNTGHGAHVFPVMVGLATLVVFGLTLAPTVTAEDSGELISAAWHFGVAHPPGYPLWTLLCGVLVHLLPVGGVAWRANVFSAVCGAGAAVVAYAALRETRVSRPAAAAAALVWVWSRWFWSQSVVTEVYALNALFTAGVLWSTLRWQRTRRTAFLYVSAVLFGLGMCNHHTIALVGLALVVWVLLQSPGLLKQWRLMSGCVGIFALGLLPYTYLPLRAQAQPAINWGDPSSLGAFWDHVSRAQYGAIGPMKTVEPRSLERFAGQVHYFAESVADDLTTWLAVAAVAGLGLLFRGGRRWLLILVVLWMLCTGLLFVVLANYDLDRTSRWAMRVFFIPVSLGAAVPLVFVLDGLIALCRAAARRRRRVSAVLTAIVAAVAPTVQLVSHWRDCDYSNYWYAYDHAVNLYHCMLPGAMVFPSGDHNAFPLVYLQYVEGYRRDVVIADIYGYIAPRLYARRPADAPEDPATWVARNWDGPVYYSTKRAPAVPNTALVPSGLLYRLMPVGGKLDTAGLLEGCHYRNESEPTVVDLGASHIMVDWEFFLGLSALDKSEVSIANVHFSRAAAYGEGIKEVYNNIGSAFGDHGLNREAVAYFKQAAALDRHYILARRNLFRLFSAEGEWDRARAMLAEIIEVAPDDAWAYGEMGFVLFDRLGEPASAARYWQESLRRDPAQPHVIQALNRYYQRSTTPPGR